MNLRQRLEKSYKEKTSSRESCECDESGKWSVRPNDELSQVKIWLSDKWGQVEASTEWKFLGAEGDWQYVHISLETEFI